MASLGQKLGHLMLHSANNLDNAVSFRNPTTSRIQKLPAPQATWRVNNSAAASVSASSADGVGTGKTFGYTGHTTFSNSLISATFTGYISSGTYYWSWAIKNTTTGNFLPIVSGGPYYASNAKTRTISTIQGNQTMNCVAPYQGSVHSYASQNWVTFDASNESSGNTFELWVAASDQPGGTWYANASQTIYAKEFVMCYGMVTGMQYDHTYSNS